MKCNDLIEKETNINFMVERERERELTCEFITGLLSRAMGQMLLPRVGGGVEGKQSDGMSLEYLFPNV